MFVVIFICLLLIVYSYFVYPLALNIVAKNGVEIDEKESVEVQPMSWPKVAIIVAAYNEQQCIGQRIKNLLGQNYSGEIDIYVGSDGSTDQTNDILLSHENRDEQRLNVTIFEKNRGKMSVLNDLVAQACSDILLFTDANTEFSENVVTELVTSFSEGVGAVSGELRLVQPEGNQNEDGIYWRYEQSLKLMESKFGCLLGANGAIYAIRKELYQPLPADTIVDDFSIVMNVKRQGFQVIYNNKAVAEEEVAPSLIEEYKRRVRIGQGNYKALFRNLWAFSLKRPMFAWCYISHKVLRWFIPHLLLLIFFISCVVTVLDQQPLLLILQCIFYCIAGIGIKAIMNSVKVPKLIAFISFFVLMNIALAHGFLRFLFANQSGKWQRTIRNGDSC